MALQETFRPSVEYAENPDQRLSATDEGLVRSRRIRQNASWLETKDFRHPAESCRIIAGFIVSATEVSMRGNPDIEADTLDAYGYFLCEKACDHQWSDGLSANGLAVLEELRVERG